MSHDDSFRPNDPQNTMRTFLLLLLLTTGLQYCSGLSTTTTTTATATATSAPKLRFKNLNPNTFRHPLDAAGTALVQGSPLTAPVERVGLCL
jgi:hypothetical protein